MTMKRYSTLSEIQRLLSFYESHPNAIPSTRELTEHYRLSAGPAPTPTRVEDRLLCRVSGCENFNVISLQEILEKFPDASALKVSCDDEFEVTLSVCHVVPTTEYEEKLRIWEEDRAYTEGCKQLHTLAKARLDAQRQRDEKEEEYKEYLRLREIYEKSQA